MNELYLCIYIKAFPIQALLRLRPELRSHAVAVMHGEAPFQQVCSLNRYARQVGVIEGMSRAEMDSFPAVTLLKRSITEEQSTQTAALECAQRYSPRVETNSSEGAWSCVLDIAGTEKLFGSPQIMAMSVLEDFANHGLRGAIAVSFNFHTAVCLARGSSSRNTPIVIPAGEERQALAHLSLTALDISSDYAETLSQWGVSTLGTLAMLPEKDLIGRLGQEGQRLRQLARGERGHLFQPVEPSVALVEYIELDSPVDVLDSLLFGVNLMLEQLISRASARVLALAVVIAELGLEGGATHTRVVRPALPSNDKQLWIKLMHFDWIAHPPPAAVVSLQLKAETGEPGQVQLGLFSHQLPEPGRLDLTLARIRSVVGEDRVGRIELKDSHAPEAFRIKPFSISSPVSHTNEMPSLPVAAMRALRPPEKAIVTVRDHHPHIFYFRGIAYQAEKAYGPWRATGGWWADGCWSIEEWDVIAHVRDKISSDKPGALLCACITREVATDRWQIEALYD